MQARSMQARTALHTRTSYACAALCVADSIAPLRIAHALSKLLSCTHAIRAGLLYSYADDDVMSERSSSHRAACASSGCVAGKPCMGGVYPSSHRRPAPGCIGCVDSRASSRLSNLEVKQ